MPSRTIDRTGPFRRDLRRELKGPLAGVLVGLLQEATDRLRANEPLPFRFRDHGLVGEWAGFRDCHLRSDLVLIYRLIGDDGLQLVRLGSHSELGI